MSDFLTEMSQASSLRARATRASAEVSGLQSRARSAPPPRPLRLKTPGFDVIAEVKLASPSEGRLVDTRSGHTVVSLGDSYARNGARAVSVLTEPERFAGSLEDLEAVAAAVDLPVMRKDFLVDPVQVVEARAAGASGVLLIARMLPREALEEMTDLALAHGMFVVVEVFDRPDLEDAAAVFDRDVLVGVNCRDLASLGVDTTRFAALAPHLPDHLPAVAESGMTSPDDVASVAGLGYRMALVGSTLVSQPDPGKRMRRFLAAGRDALAGVTP